MADGAGCGTRPPESVPTLSNASKDARVHRLARLAQAFCRATVTPVIEYQLRPILRIRAIVGRSSPREWCEFGGVLTTSVNYATSPSVSGLVSNGGPSGCSTRAIDC